MTQLLMLCAEFEVTHLRVRKYDTKSDIWYRLLRAPETGDIKGALAIAD